jgi:uncharacterized protein YabN with tetrapyrrole methylase and pyrophosphatase domain
MKIYDFLVDLSVDPEALARFRNDPEAALDETDLSEAERQAVREGNVRTLFAQFPGHERHTQPVGMACPPEPPGEAVIEPPGNPLDKKGLTVVGLGIRALQTTREARVCIAQASKVLYLVADPVSEGFVRRLNPTAETLENFYRKGKLRIEIYKEMVERILSCLEESGDLCVVFYGHPGVLCYPGREALRRARLKGVSARMLPGVSAEDNLIADLGIDPTGLQSYEATSFLIYRYRFDMSAGLVLWQVDVLGETRWDPPHKEVPGRLKVLADYLMDFYGRDHQVFLYRAAELPSGRAMVERLALGDLPGAQFQDLVAGSTLYVPPKGPPNLDSDMVKKLGME